MYSLTTVTPPSSEPVSLALAKTHLGVAHDADDTWIAAAIAGARELTEKHCGRRWLTQTLRLTLNDWPDCLAEDDPSYDAEGRIRLPVEPVQSISSVKYLDEDKVLTTVDADDTDTWLDHSPPLVGPDVDSDGWPTVGDYMGAVRVEFVAGSATGAEVPPAVIPAMLLCVADWYEARNGRPSQTGGDGLPMAATALLDKLWTGAY